MEDEGESRRRRRKGIREHLNEEQHLRLKVE